VGVTRLYGVRRFLLPKFFLFLHFAASLGKDAGNSVVLALPIKSTGVPIRKKY